MQAFSDCLWRGFSVLMYYDLWTKNVLVLATILYITRQKWAESTFWRNSCFNENLWIYEFPFWFQLKVSPIHTQTVFMEPKLCQIWMVMVHTSNMKSTFMSLIAQPTLALGVLCWRMWKLTMATMVLWCIFHLDTLAAERILSCDERKRFLATIQNTYNSDDNDYKAMNI